MPPMAPTRPTRLDPTLPSPRECHLRLAAGLTAAAAARAGVEAAIRTWCLPVDPDAAVLLTSELVSNAVTHGSAEPGVCVTLTIRCEDARLRVVVHDGSADLPMLSDAPADAETGRGLLLVASLATEWGFHRTPTGKAVYFTLAFLSDLDDPEAGSPDGEGSTSVS